MTKTSPTQSVADYISFSCVVDQICLRANVFHERLAGPADLSLLKSKVVFALDLDPHLNQKQLALLTGVSSMKMTRVIDQMQLEGLIERRKHLRDRRQRTVLLTRQASAMLPSIRTALATAEAKMFARLTLGQRKALMALLHTVSQNLDAVLSQR